MEQQVLDINEKLMHAPAALVAAAFAICVGYWLTQAAFFANRWVPTVIVVLTALLFPVLQLATEQQQAVQVPRNTLAEFVLNAVLGFIIGFAAWAAHGLVVKRLLDKFFGGATDQSSPAKPPGA